MKRLMYSVIFLLFGLLIISPQSSAQVQTPSEFIGIEIGADYQLADYHQIVDYLRYLEDKSNRIQVRDLGETTMGNRFVLVAISSEDNRRNLDQLIEIQSQLADPRGMSDSDAQNLIKQGKTVVLLNCALHSSEIGSSQLAPQLAYRLATSEKEDIVNILDNVIVLMTPAHNPDGQIMVTEWYRKHRNAPRPFLYHKYVGHDDNRDWFMFTQKESRITVNKIHNVWHPQIVHDLHQMGSRGARIFLPPYIDPIEPNVHPILVSQLNMLGETMAAALIRKGKTGVLTNAIFDAWTPARAYQHYHGGVRILSELASADLATPVEIPFSSLRSRSGYDTKMRSAHFPKPWPGGTWRLQDIIDYERIVILAELKHASGFREGWLRGFYQIHKDACDYTGDPWGYLIPNNPKKQTEIKELLDVLNTGAVEIYRIQEDHSVNGITCQSGDYVVPLAQPYGPFARALLEKRDYPKIVDASGQLKAPYDMVAHNLPLLMYVPIDTLRSAPKHISGDPVPYQPLNKNMSNVDGKYVAVTPESYGADIVAIKLAQAGVRVHRSMEDNVSGNEDLPIGSYIVKNTGSNKEKLNQFIKQTPVHAKGIRSLDDIPVLEIDSPRFALYHSWVPSMDEGWTRWIFDHYGIAFHSIKNKEIKNLSPSAPYDAIIFANQGKRTIMEGFTSERAVKEYRGGIEETGMAALREFVKNGGTILSWGSSTEAFIDGFWLNVTNALEDVSYRDFYVPGSILKVEVNDTHPMAYGLQSPSTILFRRGEAFNVKLGNTFARFPSDDPLETGWITGDEYIEGKPVGVEVPYGKGRVILLGFGPQFRAQSRGSFKFLFNAILLAAGEVGSL